jgi:phage shock protein A
MKLDEKQIKEILHTIIDEVDYWTLVDVDKIIVSKLSKKALKDIEYYDDQIENRRREIQNLANTHSQLQNSIRSLKSRLSEEFLNKGDT